MEREPNTIYTLSLSYGKDSLACLGAIEELGLPLDRIVHAEVWATDTIPADLPPMVEFKKKADKIIKERYGIEVEHVYATKKNGGGCLTSSCLTPEQTPNNTGSISTVSQNEAERGALDYLNKTCLPKLTYEDIFYRTLKPRGGGGTNLLRIPDENCSMVQRRTQRKNTRQEYTVSQFKSKEYGATQCSKCKHSTIYGFPYGSWMGGWCRELKRVFFKPENDGRYKYRSVSWNSKRRTRTHSKARKEERNNATACNGRLGRGVLP